MKFKSKLLSILAILALCTIPSRGAEVLSAFAGPIYRTSGTPGNGTSEVQTLTFGGTPTGGTFTLTFSGRTTAAITWSATNNTLRDNIDTALEALSTIRTGGVTTAVGTMTAGVGTITVTFAGENAKLAVAEMTRTSSLTGTSPTLVVSTTTAGVTADGRRSPKGALCVDITNAILYQNTGTAPNPTWAKVGPDAQLTLLAANTPTAAVADIGAATQDTLTDSSGGSATTTLAAVADASAAVTDTSAASLASTNTTIGVIKDALASVAAELAKVKTDETATRAKLNDLLAKLRTGTIVTP